MQSYNGETKPGACKTIGVVTTERIVGALFPEQPLWEGLVEEIPLGEKVPLFSEVEMVKAIKVMKNGTGLRVEVLKSEVYVIPRTLLSMFNI